MPPKKTGMRVASTAVPKTAERRTTSRASADVREGRPVHPPLFELAALTPQEQRINEHKLKKFLAAHGLHSIALPYALLELTAVLGRQENILRGIDHSFGGSS
jgi:hypothetical protein